MSMSYRPMSMSYRPMSMSHWLWFIEPWTATGTPLRRFYLTSESSLVCTELEVTTIGCTSYKTSKFAQRRQPESRSIYTPLLKDDWSTTVPLAHTGARGIAASNCYKRWKQGRLWEWSWEYWLDAFWTIVSFLQKALFKIIDQLRNTVYKSLFAMQADLVICSLFICDFVYMRLRIEDHNLLYAIICVFSLAYMRFFQDLSFKTVKNNQILNKIYQKQKISKVKNLWKEKKILTYSAQIILLTNYYIQHYKLMVFC